MSSSEVLVKIRLLLSERLARPPTRGDNQRLSVAIWDLHNFMPGNTELFDIWHNLSSSKRDSIRFEQVVRRLADFLQSSTITGIAPALRTAAAFYNQNLTERTGGQNTVIGPTVTVIVPEPAAAPLVRLGNNQPSAITVERLSSSASFLIVIVILPASDNCTFSSIVQ